MYVATRTRKYKNKVYTSSQIVEGYRDENGNPRQRTLLDITKLGSEKIARLKAALQDGNLVNWDKLPGICALDYGIVYSTLKVLESIGFPEILGEEGRKHWPTIAAMIANRIDAPCAKYSLRYWAKNTACAALLRADEKDFHHNACYEAIDFLCKEQIRIENAIFRRRSQPVRIFFYDITSSYFEGSKAEIAAYGYSRDHRKDRKQVVIGLVTDADGLPVCVEVFKGNTRDCATVKKKIDELKSRFGVEKACFVGDRGMRTVANIDHIRENGLDFILALNHREVLKLARIHGPLQLGLFDERNIADITVDGRRLIVCRNPIAGDDTKRRRNELLTLTEEKLKKIQTRVETGGLKKPDAIRKAIDRPFAKWRMEKFFKISIDEGVFIFERDQEAITSAACLDGVYVIETTLDSGEMPAEKIQTSYKTLQLVENAFRCTKDELEIRPVYHWKDRRIRGHVFLCFLAYMVEQRMRMGLRTLPEERRPEWNEFLSALRGWRIVSVPGRSDLKAHHTNFTPELSAWLNACNINASGC